MHLYYDTRTGSDKVRGEVLNKERVQCIHPAKSNISLTSTELSALHVNNDFVKSKSLDFVDGSGTKGNCVLDTSAVLFLPMRNTASCLQIGTACGCCCR